MMKPPEVVQQRTDLHLVPDLVLEPDLAEVDPGPGPGRVSKEVVAPARVTCVILILANCCWNMSVNCFTGIFLVKPQMEQDGVTDRKKLNWKFIVSLNLSFFVSSSSFLSLL